MLTYDVCIIACEGVSKENLVGNFVNQILKEEYKITLGIDLPIKTLQQKVRLQFWLFPYNRLAKVENWEEFVSKKIKGSKGIILIYDITNVETLSWVSDKIQVIKENLDHVPSILILGTNLDLGDNREISEEQIDHFKQDHNIAFLMEISLKTGENIEKSFMKLIEMMLGNTRTDYKIDIKMLVFLRENKRLAIFLFFAIISVTFLLSWLMYYLIYGI
ncbi:MAG: hypothetical protein KGD58_08250 [Candidatus Lokiarchaeota archaeon]|nr:hypothetical protein [Candidatus Lokiarchaeota archaeon]